MNLSLLIFDLMAVVCVLGVPHHGSEHSHSLKNEENFNTRIENNSSSDKLYRKEWDSYWESYYRNLMNKLKANTYRDPKRSGKLSQSYRSDNVDVDESTKLINDLLRPFESVGKQTNVSIEMVSMISVLLAIIGVVAVALVNVQQAALMGEISTLKSRIAASDISQSSICASVIGLTNADIGRTLGGGYDDSPSEESGYLAAISAVNTPTCS